MTSCLCEIMSLCLAGTVANVDDSNRCCNPKPKGAEFNPHWRQGLSLSKKV